MSRRLVMGDNQMGGTPRRPSIQDGLIPTIELSPAHDKSDRLPQDENIHALRGNSYDDFEFSKPIPSALTEPSTCNDYGDRMLRAQLENDDDEALPSVPDTDRPLEDQLREALQTHAGPGASAVFLPVKQLQRLMTIDNVIKELSKCPKLNSDSIEEYARGICGKSSVKQKDFMSNLQKGSMKKIFAILVLMGRVKTIPEFLDAELTDADLPFGKYGESKGKFDLCCKKEERPLKCFKSWKQDHIDRFYNWQWSMISPFFSKGPEEKVQFYNFEDGIILPWIFDSRTCNEGQDPVEVPGGYSVVWKVKIHPEHHEFHQTCPADAGFAVKRLGSQKRSDFNKEVDILKKFSVSPHPHLISLLATFKLRNQYYLLFPWAEGDLLNFWEDNMPNPSRDLVLTRWMSMQCLGLASGLAAIHLYNPSYSAKDPGKLSSENAESFHDNEKNRGRHGDIKPENVLRFLNPAYSEDLGVLQISDFGLAVFNSRYSASGQPSQGVARTPTYRPPEADIKGGTVSRSWDIWTLGCLYLEFLTWLLGGSQLLAEFRECRLSPDIWGVTWLTDIYFEVVQTDDNSQSNAMMVKPSVTNWILKLHAHQNCTQFVHDFLDLIEKHMIIVESDNPLLKRASCETINSQLHGMNHRCQTETRYCFKPVPWELKVEDVANLVAVKVPLSDEARNADRVTNRSLRVHTGRMRTTSGALAPPSQTYGTGS